MNAQFKALVAEFLKAKTIAVIGISRDKQAPANAIYRKFAEKGYRVVGVTPKADHLDDIPCVKHINDVDEPVDAAMICTPASATGAVLEACHQKGIALVWIHSAMGPGSFDAAAVAHARKLGMKVIPGGCPMMELDADIFHKVARVFVNWSGKMNA